MAAVSEAAGSRQSRD